MQDAIHSFERVPCATEWHRRRCVPLIVVYFIPAFTQLQITPSAALLHEFDFARDERSVYTFFGSFRESPNGADNADTYESGKSTARFIS